MTQHGKRYSSARTAIDRERVYSPVEAIRLLKSAEAAKFDETVEVHINLGIDATQSDQMVRGSVSLPLRCPHF